MRRNVPRGIQKAFSILFPHWNGLEFPRSRVISGPFQNEPNRQALKLGKGIESYAQLAQAPIGGLALSVMLTIFLVPAGFYLAYRNRSLSV